MRLHSVGDEKEAAPSLDELELRHRKEQASMELLLLWKGRIAGHALAQLVDASPVYREGPVGAGWARQMLAEAIAEWARENSARRI